MTAGEAVWSVLPQSSLPEMVAGRVVAAIRAGERIVDAGAGRPGLDRQPGAPAFQRVILRSVLQRLAMAAPPGLEGLLDG